jgi:glucokinase
MIGQDEKLVGVEVSGTSLKAVALDGAGTFLESFRAEIAAAEPTTMQLAAFINELKGKLGNFQRVGIAVPGLLNRQSNRVVFSQQMPEHADSDLARQIFEATQVEVLLENDANSAAFGEFKMGAGRGSRDMFFVTLGSGIGGAFIFDGKLWRGAAGFAGEFGHITVDSEEGLSLEDVASSANIIRRTRHRVRQDNTSSLVRINQDTITVSDIVREANGGDGFSKMMLERTGNYIGIAIASVINLLNMEKIILGGKIMEAGAVVLDAVRQSARRNAFPPSFETAVISAGELGASAAAVGVALLTASEPFKEPNN